MPSGLLIQDIAFIESASNMIFSFKRFGYSRVIAKALLIAHNSASFEFLMPIGSENKHKIWPSLFLRHPPMPAFPGFPNDAST